MNKILALTIAFASSAIAYGKPVEDTDPEARCYGGYGGGAYPVYIPVPVNNAGTVNPAAANLPPVTGVQQLQDGSLLLFNGNTPIGRTLPGRTINTANGPINPGAAQPIPANANNVPQITGQQVQPNGTTVLYSGNRPVATLPAGSTIGCAANATATAMVALTRCTYRYRYLSVRAQLTQVQLIQLAPPPHPWSTGLNY
ncbi:unnamed protein product [Medioppia subpectinata]|uniref:Uncharacterized protein n=1 Tax=Medioppia subpectinata TaxID=1979941 RepID=A0A7R9L6F9_9ACAR|nr:unnamed protein product [Medioppia subpectinata]CAG2116280.1 unnamed protein product [Medioppia subpectinata]